MTSVLLHLPGNEQVEINGNTLLPLNAPQMPVTHIQFDEATQTAYIKAQRGDRAIHITCKAELIK